MRFFFFGDNWGRASQTAQQQRICPHCMRQTGEIVIWTVYWRVAIIFLDMITVLCLCRIMPLALDSNGV